MCFAVLGVREGIRQAEKANGKSASEQSSKQSVLKQEEKQRL